MIRIDDWKQNLENVEERIQAAVRAAGRQRDEIQIVVVTKTHAADIIEELLELGVRDIGENYVQESLEKKKIIAANEIQYSDVRWHMIGHVQSRKAAAITEHFDYVHSVDSLKLARRLDKFAGESGRQLPILLQVNVSGEESKHGFDALDENAWPELAAMFEELADLKQIQIRGLMCMPPLGTVENEARRYFAKTRRLRELLAREYPQIEWKQLSMGMSADFESAILEGASILRLGTIILGPRAN